MRSRKTISRAAALVLASLVLIAAGCGGGDDDADVAATTEETAAGEADETVVSVEGFPGGGNAFVQKSLQVRSGAVTFQFENLALPGSFHNFCLEDGGGKYLGCTDYEKDSDSLTVDLKPGQYTYYCSVPGHRGEGMVGKLTVSQAAPSRR